MVSFLQLLPRKARYKKAAESAVVAPTESKELAVGFQTLSVEASEAQEAGRPEDETPDSANGVFARVDHHLISVDEVFVRFSSSPTRGLEARAVMAREKRDGSNVLSPPKSHWLAKFMHYFFDGFGVLMWVASLVAFLAWRPLGHPPDPGNLSLAIVLLLVIMLQTIFHMTQDWNTSKVMGSIKMMVPTGTVVTRDGERVEIAARGLVMGDVVHLKLGDRVPADLRLVETSPDLKFDRSVLTGESDPVAGTVDSTEPRYLEAKNIALMGTFVTNGTATGVVTSTGDRTVLSRIANLASSERTEPTLLQKEVNAFVFLIATLAVLTALLTIILWAAWLRTSHPNFLTLSNTLVNAVGVLVGFMPAGMPLAMTLALTIIAKRMFHQRILTKNLTTVETLGSVGIIGSDKTGTLTQNKMFVARVGLLDRTFDILQLTGADQFRAIRPCEDMVQAAVLCNDAVFDAASASLPPEHRGVNGDATDGALLRFAASHCSVEAVRGAWRRQFEVPFNSQNKFMLVAMTSKADNDVSTLVFVKGAPDVLLTRCVSALNHDGTTLPLDEASRAALVEQQAQWSSEGMRVLLLCRRKVEDFAKTLKEDADADVLCGLLNQELTVIGLVGIVDPPRPEIPEVVKRCRQAGIRLFMITGDFALTAKAIAIQVGIFTPDVPCHTVANLGEEQVGTHDEESRVQPTRLQRWTSRLTRKHHHHHARKKVPLYQQPAVASSLLLNGSDLIGLTDAQWDRACTYTEIVFARTTPEQKLRIVKEFRERGAAVAITGDGVNDAAALKAAHIGVAMGGGSEVAREAADMVLLDDNFGSILVAIESGRTLFDNLKKVILYLLPAGSFSELMPILVNIFLGVPLPLTSFLMICICVLTDIPPSLSLIFEKPESDIMFRPPRVSKRDRLTNRYLFFQAYFFIGLVETICAHSMFFLYMYQAAGLRVSDLVFAFEDYTDGFHGYTADQLKEFLYTGQSIYFVTLVICQYGNLFATRTRRLSVFQQNPFFGPTRNLYLLLAIVCSLLLACAVLYLSFLNDLFHTRHVPVRFWFIPMGFAVGIVAVDEIRKYVVRTYPESCVAKCAW